MAWKTVQKLLETSTSRSRTFLMAASTRLRSPSGMATGAGMEFSMPVLLAWPGELLPLAGGTGAQLGQKDKATSARLHIRQRNGLSRFIVVSPPRRTIPPCQYCFWEPGFARPRHGAVASPGLAPLPAGRVVVPTPAS